MSKTKKQNCRSLMTLFQTTKDCVIRLFRIKTEDHAKQSNPFEFSNEMDEDNTFDDTLGLIQSFSSFGCEAEALEVVEKELRHDPKNIVLLSYQCKLLAIVGQKNTADKVYQRIRNVYPCEQWPELVYYNIFDYLLLNFEENQDTIRSLAATCIEVLENNSLPFMKLYELEKKSSNCNAVKALENGLQAVPSSTEIAENLVDEYVQNAEFEKAKRVCCHGLSITCFDTYMSSAYRFFLTYHALIEAALVLHEFAQNGLVNESRLADAKDSLATIRTLPDELSLYSDMVEKAVLSLNSLKLQETSDRESPLKV